MQLDSLTADHQGCTPNFPSSQFTLGNRTVWPRYLPVFCQVLQMYATYTAQKSLQGLFCDQYFLSILAVSEQLFEQKLQQFLCEQKFAMCLHVVFQPPRKRQEFQFTRLSRSLRRTRPLVCPPFSRLCCTAGQCRAFI